MLRNKYVSAAIAVLFVLVAGYNLKFFYSRGKTSAKPFIPVAVQMKHSPSVLKKIHERLPEQQDKSRWKRDPFGLQTEAERAGYGSIQLMGIIKRDGKSHALINGGVYTANQRIGDSVIKEIKRESVVLSTNGKLHELYFDDYKVLKEKTK
jgi:type II secretory pathway component PulC